MSKGLTPYFFLLLILIAGEHCRADHDVLKSSELIQAHFSERGLIDPIDFSFIRTTSSSNGTVHHKYQLTLNGVPVENKYLYLHRETGGDTRISENITNDTKLISSYQHKRSKTIDPVVRSEGSHLVYILSREKSELVLAESMKGIDPVTGELISIFTDPFTGKIFRSVSHRCDLDSTGMAQTHYMGIHPIVTNHVSPGHFILESSSGMTSVRDLVNNTNPVYAVPLTDQDNLWEDDQFATDAFVAATAYREMLNTRFNRNSLDDNGMPVKCLINYGTNVNNAFWNGQQVVYGSPTQGNLAMTTYDITGHEFTHGMIQHSAGLIYSYESGAINEALSDIFGVALEYDATGILNWEVGEETGSTLRSLADPALYDQPVYYRGSDWYYGSGDHGGVHINSGVINRWFYLISEGGQGADESGRPYDIDGLGFDTSLLLIYETLNNHLFPDDDMTGFRKRVLDHVIDKYGLCSSEFESIHEAFKAVGIGPTDLSAPTSSRLALATGYGENQIGIHFTRVFDVDSRDFNHMGSQADVIQRIQKSCPSKNSRTKPAEELNITHHAEGVIIASLSDGEPLNGRTYHVISATGKTVLKGIVDAHQLTLHDHNFSPGFYILVVRSLSKDISKRFVIR